MMSFFKKRGVLNTFSGRGRGKVVQRIIGLRGGGAFIVICRTNDVKIEPCTVINHKNKNMISMKIADYPNFFFFSFLFF